MLRVLLEPIRNERKTILFSLRSTKNLLSNQHKQEMEFKKKKGELQVETKLY